MASKNTTINWYGDYVIDQIKGATDDGLLAGARELIRMSRPVVPVDTGALRASGYAANSEESDYRAKENIHRREIRPEEGEAIAGYAAEYAIYVERGTRFMPARPFLRNTMDSHKERIMQVIVGGMQEVLK